MPDKVIPGQISLYLRRVTHDRPLIEGDVIRLLDGSFHYIQYVNSSGAYAVPLASVNREIGGHTVAFSAGGRTISARSAVEVVHPLAMGGNSQEYRRYAKMASASAKQLKVGEMTEDKGVKGVTFDSWDTSDIDLPDPEANQGTFAPGTSTTTTPSGAAGTMAKKASAAAKGKTNGAVKAAKKAPKEKTYSKCICGCGADTTGHFAPGHDARFHGWLKKLADGRMKPSEIPQSLRNKIGLVAKGEGFVAKTPEFYKED